LPDRKKAEPSRVPRWEGSDCFLWILFEKTWFYPVFSFCHFGTVTKNHETQICSGFWWGVNSYHRIFDPTDQEKLNHKQANEKFFCVQAARRMKNSHSPFLFLKIKKARGNLKKMDETEVYRYKKAPVSEETGQGAAICIC